MKTTAVLIIFAKYPQPGRVKTRLIGSISAEQAAELHRHCLVATWRVAAGVPGTRPLLAISPDDAATEFQRVLGDDAACRPQGQGDLGARLERAARRAFEESAGRVILLGCDCPSLDRRTIETALRALDDADVVLGPAVDGGYYLLGLRSSAPLLFERIDWGTDRVAAQTRARCDEAGLSIHELAALRDLDRWEDLAAWVRDCPTAPRHVTDLRSFVNQLLSEADRVSD
ncbi:MAG: TIGR04282 family arsenosugar biosynthesis glycosyltransferase [Phycisphaerae bacterium]